MIDPQAALVQERKDARRLEKIIERQRCALLSLCDSSRLVDLSSRAYFVEYGWQHEDGCPEDDTCDCELSGRFSSALSELVDVANHVLWEMKFNDAKTETSMHEEDPNADKT